MDTIIITSFISTGVIRLKWLPLQEMSRVFMAFHENFILLNLQDGNNKVTTNIPSKLYQFMNVTNNALHTISQLYHLLPNLD